MKKENYSLYFIATFWGMLVLSENIHIIQFAWQGLDHFGDIKKTLYTYFMEVSFLLHIMQPNLKTNNKN